MKKFITVILFYSSPLSLLAQKPSVPKHAHSLSGKPLCFIENKGQITDQYGNPRNDIDYKIAAAPGLNIFIGNGAMHYQFSKSSPAYVETQCVASLPHTGIASLPHTHNTFLSPGEGRGEVSMYRIDVTLENANPHALIIREEAQCYHENYYTAATKGKLLQAGSYSKITYQNIYPEIDWVLYIKEDHLEYDFVVRPGGNVSDIKMRYDGISEMQKNNGSITAISPGGYIQEGHLHSYIEQTGKEVVSAFVLKNNVLGFEVKNNTKTVIIDPTLEWATYYGNQGGGNSLACDMEGNVYMVGTTQSTTGVATTGAYQTTLGGGNDAYLAKFDSNGMINWATYYGGYYDDEGYGIAYDGNGNIFITGVTNSEEGIATPGSYQDTYGGGVDSVPRHRYGPYDAFLAKFTNDGALQWATYYGGSGLDYGYAICCDHEGNAYIAGLTASADSIATAGAYQTTMSHYGEGFLAKFSSAGAILWATYYGDSITTAQALICDQANNVFIAGYTTSDTGIATTGAFQTNYANGFEEGFLAKFNSAGALQWGTYYGASGGADINAITSDASGNVYITGNTESSDSIATAGTYEDTYTGGDYSFLVKFNNNGQRIWGTYYGGGGDAGYGLASDGDSNIYMAGTTASTTGIATRDGYLTYPPGSSGNAFLAQFSISGQLVYGTYFGGSNESGAADAAYDGYGNVYLTGGTSSPGIATSHAFDTDYTAGALSGETYLAKFTSFPVPPSGVKEVNTNNANIALYPNPANDLLTVKWSGITAPNVQINVINMEGQQLYTTSAPSAASHTVIPVSALPDGMYVCVLQSGVNRYYSKFTVVR